VIIPLIKPVTMDSIAAAEPSIPVARWRRLFTAAASMSVAERSSRRYMTSLLLLVLVILPLQLYVWVCTNLSKKIDDIIASELGSLVRATEALDSVGQDYRNLKAVVTIQGLPVPAPAKEERNPAPRESPSPPAVPQQTPPQEEVPEQDQRKLTPTEEIIAAKIQTQAKRIYSSLEKALYETYVLQRIVTLLTYDGLSEQDGFEEANKEKWDEAYEYASARLFEATTNVYKIQQEAGLLTGIVGSFVLPILFGAAGAIAYVIRTISDQIKSTTFSRQSPIRHLMRVVLGGFAGIVVGLFTGLTGQFNLSPLAIAFLAGYGVEGLFSMFDSIIDKFRQVRP
jgi:hypothetical protein